MSKQISITKKFLESKPYNDEDTYLVDEVKKAKAVQSPKPSYLNIVEECINNVHCPKIIQENFKFSKKGDLKKYSGVLEVIDFRLTKEFLEFNKPNIMWNNSDASTSTNAVILSQDCYDGVKYFAKTDTLSVPLSIKLYLNSHTYIDVKCAVYNYPDRKIERPEFSTCKDKVDKPSLNFKFIPEEVSYSKFEDNYYEFNQKDGTALFYTNLPVEYYSKCIIDNEFLAYNVNEGYYVGHSNSCEAKMNHLCYDIAKNGLQKPIQFFILKDGTLCPAWSNKRVLTALYLQLPTIPAVIISNPNVIDSRTIYKDSEDCRELMNKYLSPYFISL